MGTEVPLGTGKNEMVQRGVSRLIRQAINTGGMQSGS